MAGGIVFCRREAERGAVLQRQNTLHRTLAERFVAQDVGAFQILQAASDNFRGAGAAQVNKHDDGHPAQLVTATAGAVGRILGRVASFRRHNQFASRQELLANVYGLFEQTAGVPPQIEDQRLHPLFLELLQRHFQVVTGFLTELNQPHIANVVFAEREFLLPVDVFYHVHVDGGALEAEFFHHTGGGTENGEFNIRARITAQGFDRIWQSHFFGALSIDLHDAIARHYAGLESRAFLHRGNHGYEIVLQGHNDAQPTERALRVILQFFVFFRLHELAVRIESVQHPFQRSIYEVLVCELLAVDIVPAHLLHYEGKEFQAGVSRVLLRGLRGANVHPCANHQVYRQHQDYGPVNYASSHKLLKFSQKLRGKWLLCKDRRHGTRKSLNFCNATRGTFRGITNLWYHTSISWDYKFDLAFDQPYSSAQMLAADSKVVSTPAADTVRSAPAASWKRIIDPVEPFLEAVNQRLAQQVAAFDPEIAPYADYALNGQGKHLRPALVALTAKALGPVNDSHVTVAVIIEMVHLATLVHDDVMDEAEIRRGRLTLAAHWGNDIAVLFGDCLFARALTLAAGFPTTDVCRAVAMATNTVCSGEILQNRHRGDFRFTREEYFRVLEMKTAELFALSCDLSAFLSGAPGADREALRQFGMAFGTAYQVYDDCIDLFGSEEAAGKSLGTDLTKGKLTLPVLLLWERADAGDRERLQGLVQSWQPLSMKRMEKLLAKYDTLGGSAAIVRRYLEKARQALAALPPSHGQAGLLGLTTYLARQTDSLGAVPAGSL
jgi:octaprenyl-diphosphate synthase